MIRTFDELFHEIEKGPQKTVIVPAAGGVSIMKSCKEAYNRGICDVVLVGNTDKMSAIAESNGIDMDGIRMEDEKDPIKAVKQAVNMIRAGRGDILMKGKTDTPTLLKEVLDRDTGLRTGRVLSHVAVVDMPSYPRLMLVSDGGLNIRPDLEMRMDIIRNAVEFANKLGITRPHVALLSAMEKVNPKMEETVEYDRIVRIQEETPFVDAIIEGPLAMDLAVSEEAARIKGIDSAIAGRTDIFVVPEISTANIMVKALHYLAGAKVGGLVVGAKVPIVMLSRADDAETKLQAIALGAIWN